MYIQCGHYTIARIDHYQYCGTKYTAWCGIGAMHGDSIETNQCMRDVISSVRQCACGNNL